MASDIILWLLTGRHRTDPEILRGIIRIYQEWMEAQEAEDVDWPIKINGPWTTASDPWHTVIMIIEGTEAQIKHFTFKFYKLMEIQYTALRPPMATTMEELEEIIDRYGWE